VVSPLSKLKTKQTIKQGYEESCGAVALATLLKLHGRDTNETEILDMASKTDMLSFAELAKISKAFGYEAQGYKISRDVFEKTKIPLLVLVVREAEFPHFVVAINHDGDFVSVYDPSSGDYIASKRDFYAMWEFASGGFALVVLPKAYKHKEFDMALLPSLFFGK
jgi:hypothetical protein